ncbi:ABC transporter permease [Anaerolineales bacterium HSG24]|nr:ABC transporter permease [Anaerolineales bacterium HSG24]
MLAKAGAFLRRDFQTQSSYRLNFFMQVIGILVSISIFYFISQILGTAISPYMSRYGDIDYFHFALMGIAFYPFIGISANSLSESIHEYQHTGTLEVLFISPTPILPLLLMSTLWRYCWATGETLFYLLTAAFLFQADLNWMGISSAFVVILLTIFANMGLGLINASFVLVTKRVSPLARLTRVITNLLSGIYYPIEILPNWLQTFSYFLPATYAFEALRQTMLQGAKLSDIGLLLLPLIAFSLILLPIGLISFHYAIRWAKTDGSLSQY